MSIRLLCDNCGRSYKVKSKLAGQRIRCKDCSSLIQVPSGQQDEVEEYFADDEWDESPSALPPVSSGGGLPPRAGTGTATGSTASASRPKKKKKKRRAKSANVPLKKIAAGIVGLLIVAFLITFGPGFVNEAQQRIARSRPDWREYEVPGQPISILMPGEPEPVNRVQNGVSIQGAAFELQTLRGYSGGAFTVLYADNDMELGEFFDVDDWFQWREIRLMQATLSSMSGRIEDRPISITDEGGNVHPGREYQVKALVTGREAQFTYRIYLVGDKVITALTAVGMKHEQEFQPHAARFLDSLKITASIPSVTARQTPAVRTVQPQPGGQPMSGF